MIEKIKKIVLITLHDLTDCEDWEETIIKSKAFDDVVSVLLGRDSELDPKGEDENDK